MNKRWLGVVFVSIALLVAVLITSGCAGEPGQLEEDRLVNQLFTIKGAEFFGYQEGSDDFYSGGRPSFLWYRPEASRRDISPPRSGVTPELPGHYNHVVTYFDERYTAGVYRYFREERFLGKSFDLVKFRVEWVEGSTIHASLSIIKRDDRSWSASKQGYLDDIEGLLSGLSMDYLWKSQTSLNAFLEQLKLAEVSVFEGRDYHPAVRVYLRKAMEYLFQDAFSGSWVEARLVGPSDYCSRGLDGKDGECWIRGRIEDRELQLGLIADPALRGGASVSLRYLPDAVKELIRKVEVLTLADSELGVIWGRTSYLGFQDQFGNWYILVPAE